GLSLHQAYHDAKIETKISASLEPVRAGGRDYARRFDRNEKQEAAYRRWRNALNACRDYVRDTLIHVACVGCWPTIEQLARVKEGLTQLVKYYGLPKS